MRPRYRSYTGVLLWVLGRGGALFNFSCFFFSFFPFFYYFFPFNFLLNCSAHGFLVSSAGEGH